MDTRDGRIYTPEQRKILGEIMKDTLKVDLLDMSSRQRTEDLVDNVIPMEIPPTEKQMKRNPPRVGRNEQCPCGSGKKFKRCCLNAG